MFICFTEPSHHVTDRVTGAGMRHARIAILRTKIGRTLRLEIYSEYTRIYAYPTKGVGHRGIANTLVSSPQHTDYPVVGSWKNPPVSYGVRITHNK
jgi:hypothetical protein